MIPSEPYPDHELDILNCDMSGVSTHLVADTPVEPHSWCRLHGICEARSVK